MAWSKPRDLQPCSQWKSALPAGLLCSWLIQWCPKFTYTSFLFFFSFLRNCSMYTLNVWHFSFKKSCEAYLWSHSMLEMRWGFACLFVCLQILYIWVWQLQCSSSQQKAGGGYVWIVWTRYVWIVWTRGNQAFWGSHPSLDSNNNLSPPLSLVSGSWADYLVLQTRKRSEVTCATGVWMIQVPQQQDTLAQLDFIVCFIVQFCCI